MLAGMRSVEISSASGWLMQQLSCMLRRLGIWLRITEKQKRATNGLGIYRTYHIGLIGGESLRRFYDLVGFSDPVKQAKLATLCEKAPNTNVEGVPGSHLLQLARCLTKLPMRALWGRAGLLRRYAGSVAEHGAHRGGRDGPDPIRPSRGRIRHPAR